MPSLFSVRRLALIAALLPLAPAATLAASATISQNVNLRAGPSTSFGSVAELRPGEAVDVSKCEGLFCYVTSPAGKGWVSAAYLTRDAVKPAAPAQIATTPPSAPPATTVAKAPPPPTTTPKPPVNRTAALPPKRAFPPAYAGNEPAPALRHPADGAVIVLPPADVQRPVDDFAAADTLRPKADIPGGALVGPDDAFVANDAPPDAAFPPPPGNGWGDRGWDAPRSRHFGRDRSDFAALDGGTIGAARACLVDADGGPSVCLREGERLHADADWADRAFILRNPAGLEVTVCTDAPYRDCHVFMRSGPLDFSDGRSIASISVSPTPGY
jgi:uncharacterized protein YraI